MKDEIKHEIQAHVFKKLRTFSCVELLNIAHAHTAVDHAVAHGL